MNLLDPYEGEEEEDDADGATAHQPPPSPSQFQSQSLTTQEHVSLPETFDTFPVDLMASCKVVHLNCLLVASKCLFALALDSHFSTKMRCDCTGITLC